MSRLGRRLGHNRGGRGGTGGLGRNLQGDGSVGGQWRLGAHLDVAGGGADRRLVALLFRHHAADGQGPR
ncbi:hypothetical protein UCD39_24375 [Nitrospirillum sp. BR 11752]|uniref:hypothetical protein n=1 Tax=Nitrospirillum sp. BR 11752 TaxID=3104293 RepID=UPI002EB7040A|nr:hypothetical protein [Nitrospirillum sp. BR 11752]